MKIAFGLVLGALFACAALASCNGGGGHSGDVSCSQALALDYTCCSGQELPRTVCPADFTSASHLCDATESEMVTYSQPCDGHIAATETFVDTGYEFIFDAATTKLIAVFYGGMGGGSCVSNSDPGLVIREACLNRWSKAPAACMSAGGPFASYCGGAGLPCAHTGAISADCPFPLVCNGTACVAPEGGVTIGAPTPVLPVADGGG